jgi:RimJ/RimL family protein N-acetyltransferase
MDGRAELAAVWPLFGLVVRTPRLELRYPDDHDLLVLADLATDIHEPDLRPFSVAWNLGTDDEVRQRLVQYHWARRGDWSAEAWRLELATVVDGEVVGTQGLHGGHLAVGRTVATGSWLGRRHQGRGIGTEMRAAVLHLAFAGLGVERAETGAIEGNERSLRVTTTLGYRPNGDAIHIDGDERRRELRYVLSREDWEHRRRDDIELVGLEPCLPLFGLGSPEGGPLP